MAQSIDLDPVDGIGVGTIGPAGSRQFFLRASGGGETFVFYCEKFHVQGLVTRMRQLLEAQGIEAQGIEAQGIEAQGIEGQGIEPGPEAGAASVPAEPGEPVWTIGELGLGFHESKRLFVIVAREAAEGESEGAADLATARFWVSPEQIETFTRQAEGVLAAGRPTCSHCGLPVDPSGHPCPAANGSRPIV